MTEDSTSGRQLEIEAKVVAALQRRPEIAVPAEFAARVARAMPAKVHSRGASRPMFGRLAGYLAVAAMMAVLLALAWRHPAALEAGRGFVFAVELLLVAQLLAVGLWLGIKSDNQG